MAAYVGWWGIVVDRQGVVVDCVQAELAGLG